MIAPDLTPLIRPIRGLKALPGNPRRGDVDAVVRSYERFGQRKPIVARRDGTVIAGNHQLKAAKKLGWKEIAVVYVDDDDTTAKAYALADNRIGELGSYNDAALAALIAEVAGDAGLLAATGWTLDDFDLDGAGKPVELTDPDEIPEPPAKQITKPGDVWILGDHRVRCGSATDPTDYLALFAGAQAACIFTDPPYNVAYEGGTADKLTIANDDMSDEAFDAFLFDSFTAMRAAVQPGGAIYVCHADGSGNAFRNSFVRSGFLLKQVLIWVKNQFVLGRQDYNWQHEPILYGWNPGAGHHWYGPFNLSTVLDDETPLDGLKKEELVVLIDTIRSQSTVIREDRPKRNFEHPTMKPVNLITRLIVNNTHPNDIVLDPFGGSGSTLIACHQTRRRGYLLELDPKYVDVICRRFQKHTGITPIHEATGKPVTFGD